MFLATQPTKKHVVIYITNAQVLASAGKEPTPAEALGLIYVDMYGSIWIAIGANIPIIRGYHLSVSERSWADGST